MNMDTAKTSIGQRAVFYLKGRPSMRGVITGVWPANGWVYIRFDHHRFPKPVHVLLVELEQFQEAG